MSSTTRVDERRVRARNDAPVADGPVVYWMQRDQRAEDNWALLYAQQCALEQQQPLVVVFNLVPVFGKTTLRHYDFMFTGLAETEAALAKKNIPFVLLQGTPTDTISRFVKEHKVGHVITDFNPLRFTDAWRSKVGEQLSVRLSEVDAHNIIPCWVATDKQEFAAHTFRPKVHRQLREWLTDIPSLKQHPHDFDGTFEPTDWETLLAGVDTDRSVAPVDWLVSGSEAAHKTLTEFVETKLAQYDILRNDPNEDALSNLSPYLHFGQIAPQRVAKVINDVVGHKAGKEAFLEELIVRRELTDNFCFYNPQYDQVVGAHEWAQTTIAEHASDEREYIYTQAQFEAAETHDELWNAMQRELVTCGKMHGWCRMYWAKKILEWTPDAQTAIDTALYLNDRYNLDGTDPNGIVGVMWSIAGVHDRAWTERPVFGKIRYMNYNGAKRKFDVAAYIERYSGTTDLFDAKAG
jgi:deoxyribodipyrimidine photo-lyase